MKPELLAPAGNWDCLVAAVENGADAVYLGGKRFNARMRAGNFTDQELADAVKFCHLRGVKVYVTLNTLLDNSELLAAQDYLRFLYEIKVDAIIVQDLGLVQLAKHIVPDLEVHASTQMSLCNAEGLKFVKKLGIKRAILARECSISDIANIKKNCDVPLEIFVHGALCFCYSGQCLFSSYLYGKSGNRGECLQPCRQNYSCPAKKGYLLSMKDLCLIEKIPELCKLGLVSFKIEGRLKKKEYVATVVRIYRNAIDRYFANPEKYVVSEEELEQLKLAFNREFTTGHIFGDKAVQNIRNAANIGVLAGKILSKSQNKYETIVKLKLETGIELGDGVEASTGGYVNKIFKSNAEVKDAKKGEIVSLQVHGLLGEGKELFKTSGIALERLAKKTGLRKLKISGVATLKKDSPLEITFKAGDYEATATGKVKAQNGLPITKEFLKEKISELGNTTFELADFEANIDKGAVVPFSEIKKTKREAAELLAKSIVQTRKAETKDFAFKKVRKKTSYPKIIVQVFTEEAAKEALSSGADVIIVPPQIKLSNAFLDTGAIVKDISKLDYKNYAGLFAGNIGAVNLAKKQIIGPSLNLFNSLAVSIFADSEFVTISPELNLEQIEDLAGKVGANICVLAYGKPTLMTTEASLDFSEITSYENKKFAVQRYADKTQILADQNICLISHLSELKKAGVSAVLLILREDIGKIVAEFKKATTGKEFDKSILRNTTAGWLFKKV